eukprot:2522852-Rhodomonas_salina.2
MACVALGNALVDTFFFEEHLWQVRAQPAQRQGQSSEHSACRTADNDGRRGGDNAMPRGREESKQEVWW